MDVNKALFTKLIKDYDTNKNGTIDGDEVAKFKQDSMSLFAQVYGKNSSEYKGLAEVLSNTEIKFKDQKMAGNVSSEETDFENKKYVINLDSTPQGKKLQDSTLTLTEFAGVLIHESEHIVQNDKVYNDLKRELDGNGKLAKAMMINNPYPDRYELYAEMERMYFYMKSGSYANKDTNELYKNFVKQYNEIGIDPAKHPKEFVNKFNQEEFYKIFLEKNPQYKQKCFEDKEDTFNLKQFLY